MNSLLVHSFFDELEKIADYRAALLAHELGHAQRHETSPFKNVPSSLKMAIPIAGAVGSIVAAYKKKPLLAALGGGVLSAPLLVEEAGASLRGLKALEETGRYSPEELKNMRKTLLKAFGTYAAESAGMVGSIALLAARDRHELMPAVALSAGMGGTAASQLFLGNLKKHINDSPVINDKDAQDLKKSMNVAVGIHSAKGTGSEVEKAFYSTPQTSSSVFSKYIREFLTENLKDKEQVNKVLQEGGVILQEVNKKR